MSYHRRRRRGGHGPGRPGQGRNHARYHRSRPARRAQQRRRPATVGVRRQVRHRGRDGARGRHQGQPAGAEVPRRGTEPLMSSNSIVPSQPGYLRVLAVDDEPPALDELAYLLRADARVGRLHTAGDATEALRVLRDMDIDAVFLDIRMPGLDGMELARVLGRFAKPPAVVFVTAYDDRAAEAFDLGVTDYVRKPVQAERIAESLRRVLAGRLVAAHPAVAAQRERAGDPTIPVELAGTTRMLPRSSVRWVEAQGD